MKTADLRGSLIVLSLLLILQSAIICIPEREKIDTGDYSLAVQQHVFSGYGDIFCLSKQNDFYIIQNDCDTISAAYEYTEINKNDFSEPFIYGDYMYYKTYAGTQSDTAEYIARIDLTDKNSEVKLMTNGDADIISFTVFHNKLYYLVNEISGGEQKYNLYRRNMLTGAEKLLISGLNGYGDFLVKDGMVLAGNIAYDEEEDKTTELFRNDSDRHFISLGLWRNSFYCERYSKENGRHELYSFYLGDDSDGLEFICELPNSMCAYRMFEDRIFFMADTGGSVLDYMYCDITNGEIINTAGKGGRENGYICRDLRIADYDCAVFNDMFYACYPDGTFTRVSLSDTEYPESVLTTVSRQRPSGGFGNFDEWIDYSTYIKQENDSKTNVQNDVNIISDGKYFRVFGGTLSETYEIYNAKGETVLSETTGRPLSVSMTDENIVDIEIGYGTGISVHKYYNGKTDAFSEEFLYVIANSNDMIAYINTPRENAFENRTVAVRNIFDKGLYYREFKPDFSALDTPVVSAKFSEDRTALEITYLSGDEQNEVTETFDLR